VLESSPFSLKNFSFLKFEKFITDIKNKSFYELNKNFDKQFFLNLKANLIKNLDNISIDENILKNIESKTEEQKKELYNIVLKKYQNLNFVGSDSKELFSKKLELKKALISL
jgi:hypothetical protein